MTEAGNETSSIAGLARVRLGHSELTVRPIGLGCMGMSQFYGATDDDETITTLRAAINLGVNFLDTSDIYGGADVGLGVSIRGFGHNEQLIGQAIAAHRDELVPATKFAAKLSDDHTQMVIDGRAEYVKSACEASLRRLDVEVIDLYYYHRLDPAAGDARIHEQPVVDFVSNARRGMPQVWNTCSLPVFLLSEGGDGGIGGDAATGGG